MYTKMSHFILVPFMAQGHMNPMIDLAELLSRRGVLVSVITTPVNATRFRTSINRIPNIRIVELPFPCKSLGLPDNCENLDMVPSDELMSNFFNGLCVLAEPLRMYLEEMETVPTCMIVDVFQPWTDGVARKLGIPRLSLYGSCCLSLLCTENVDRYNVYDSTTNEHEPFLVPGITDDIRVTKAQVPLWYKSIPFLSNYGKSIREAERNAGGIVVNTFSDLELSYIAGFEKVMSKKVWPVGPLSLCNDITDMSSRGNEMSVDTSQCVHWLNGRKPGSVLYVSFGSLASADTTQLMEIGLGLEASECPFIWVMKKGDNYLSEEFEERIGRRGLIIKGWAPQVMILSHAAIGGFLTHCGWNSVLESISAGVPMVTWPFFGDHFLNERLVVDFLKIGVSVGVSEPDKWVKTEDKKVRATSNDVAKAVKMVMDSGEEGEARRRRVREMGRKAKESMKEGGSSYVSLTNLVQSFSLT